MKKAIILSAIILFSITMYAQSTYRITSVTGGTLNSYTNSFEWGKYSEVDMTLTLKGNVIFISDKAKSIYILKGQRPDRLVDGVKMLIWDAIDENEIRCTLKICTYPDATKMVYVIYRNAGFGYTLEQ